VARTPDDSSPFDESTRVTGGGTDVRLVARLVVALVAVGLALAFIVLNDERVEMNFVFFTVTTRLWVGLVVALVLGALLGQGLALLRRRRRSHRDVA